MNSQQLLDYIVIPSLKAMGPSYNTTNSRMLLMATAAIESHCGHYVKQMEGPASGMWQMEPDTQVDIMIHSDTYHKLQDLALSLEGDKFAFEHDSPSENLSLIASPMYACFMARCKYSMDKEPLPECTDKTAIYNYYKRIYNTEHGAATYEHFDNAWKACNLSNLLLRV